MADEKIGLQAVFETQQFQQGLSQFMRGLDQAKAATGQTATSLNAGLGRAIKDVSVMSGALSVALGGLAVVGFTALANAISSATSTLVEFTKEGVLLQARVEQLALITQYMGQRAGYSATEIDKQTEAIRNLGIRTDVALQLQTQFVRYNLDLAKATDLARVAQNAATIANIDSSESLERLLHGITTLNVRVLRTAGIMIPSITDSFQQWADANNRTVDSMTNVEQQQALLNHVLQEGSRITGLYELSMQSVSKQLGSLTGREIPELKMALGAPLQNAFGEIIGAVRQLVQAFTAAISAGGALYPIMVKIGGVLAAAAAAVRSFLGLTGTSKKDPVMPSLSGGGGGGSGGTASKQSTAQKENLKNLGEQQKKVTELAQKQLELAYATEKVRLAEMRLRDAREAQSTAMTNVGKEVRQYNKMLREGASKDALDAQMAKVEGSLAARDAAMDETEAAEDNARVLKDSLDLMRAQLDILQAMARLQDAQKPLDVPTGAGGVSPIDDGGFSFPGADGTFEMPFSQMADDIEREKQRILDSINSMWNTIQNLPAVQWVKREWSGLMAYVKGWWDQYSPALKDTWKLISDHIGSEWKKVEEWGKTHGIDLGGILGGAYEGIKTIVKASLEWWGDITKANLLGMQGDYDGAFKGVIEATKNWGLKIFGLLGITEEDFQNFADFIVKKMDEFNVQYARFLNWLTDGEEKVSKWLIGVGDSFKRFGDTLVEWKDKAVSTVNDLWIRFGNYFRNIETDFKRSFDGIKNWLNENWSRMFEWAGEWVTWLKDTIVNRFNQAWNSIANFINNLYSKFGSALNWAGNWVTWLRNIIMQLINPFGDIISLLNQLRLIIGGAGSSGGAGSEPSASVKSGGSGAYSSGLTNVSGGSTSNVNVTFGNVNINNGMDMEIFKSQVLATVNQAVRG